MIENYYTCFFIVNLILLLFVPKIVLSWYNDANRQKKKYFIYFSVLLFTITCGLYLKASSSIPYSPYRHFNCIVGCIIVTPFLPWVINLLNKKNTMYTILYYIYFYVFLFMVVAAYLI